MKANLQNAARPGALRPVNEPARLEALNGYHVLDTEPEKSFNELVQLAAFICGTPISLVSFIDDQRQWFKARVGLEPTETPREHSFCQFAMRADDVFEVPDAALDPQFEQNPLVLGAPHIRFYAGAPLLTPEGQPLGTLCAIDTVPRHLTEEQREALRILARQVMGQLELRRANRQLKEEREKLEGVLRMANTAGEALYAGNRNEIFVKQDHRLVRVLTADIQYAEARGDYVSIHTTHDQHTVPGTLQELEQKLPVRDFARIHSQYLVRLDRIVSIEADTAQLDPVHHAESSSPPLQVPIGSSYKPALLARLNLV